MEYAKQAHTILVKAEEGLQEVLQEALAKQCYGDVAQIAPLADSIASLLRSERAAGGLGNHQQSNGRGQGPGRKRGQRSVSRRNSSKRADHYPRFERDGDKLVKVGWSKKNEEAYEHRAPKDAIMRFREHLTEKFDAGAMFTMEELLPVPTTNGGEVPSYQAYLALAWLRDRGAIRKKGRDGYTYSERAIDEAGLEELWAALPERE